MVRVEVRERDHHDSCLERPEQDRADRARPYAEGQDARMVTFETRVFVIGGEIADPLVVRLGELSDDRREMHPVCFGLGIDADLPLLQWPIQGSFQRRASGVVTPPACAW